MIEQITLPFAVGLFAVVSPCAIAFAVALVGLPVCAEGEPAAGAGSPLARPASAVRAAVAMAVSFAVVFAIVGLAVSAGLDWLLDVVGWLAVATGLALALAGIDAALRARPSIARAAAERAGRRHRLAPAATFGAVYAATALPCMLALFSAVVDQGVEASGALAAAGVTLAFGAGCASALTLPALAAAAVSGASVRLRAPLVRRAAGAFVAGAGAWLVAYWLPALLGGRIERGGAAASAANDLSGAITEAVARWELGFALVMLAISALALAAAVRPRPR